MLTELPGHYSTDERAHQNSPQRLSELRENHHSSPQPLSDVAETQ